MLPMAQPTAAALTLWALSIGCVFASPADAGPAAEAGGLTPIGTIRKLPFDELSARPAARVRGVVTQRWSAALILQDHTGGIYVDFEFARDEGVWAGEPGGPSGAGVGMEIEVEAVADPGGFSPMLMPSAIHVIGTAPLPQARVTDDAHFFTGADDCERIEIEAVVHGVEPGSAVGRVEDVAGRLSMRLERGGRPFDVVVPASALPTPPDSLIDAVVRVVGAPVSSFNPRGEHQMPLVWIDDPENLIVVEPPTTPPFEAPLVPAERLGAFRNDPIWDHIIRTRGRVSYVEPGRVLYLQGSASGVRVATRSGLAIQPGDFVEVAGFIDRRHHVCGLTDALVRVVSHGEPPEPIDITPAEMQRVNALASERYLMAKPGDFEGCLVRFPAEVVDVQSSPVGAIVLMAADSVSVIARMPDTVMPVLAALRVGTQVRVTGIGQLGWQGERARGSAVRPITRPTHLTLQVRSANDVEVIRPAPYWTKQRLFVAVAVVATTLLVALAWAGLLRRRVAQQLEIIEDKLRCEAVAGERRRIAREFHDTLEQSLAGVAMQLDAAVRRIGDEESRVLIREQRQLIGRLQTEARDFLWDLRDSLGDAGDLATALATQAAALATLADTPLRLDVARNLPRLPSEVQHHVIRIVREAVLNSFRHSRAGSVSVIAAAGGPGQGTSSSTLVVSVEDDGCGFDVGHYGIRGMQERAERIDARMTITSSQSQGTVVRMTLQSLHDDAEVPITVSTAE
jgi:signal transduction histidine kinase